MTRRCGPRSGTDRRGSAEPLTLIHRNNCSKPAPARVCGQLGQASRWDLLRVVALANQAQDARAVGDPMAPLLEAAMRQMLRAVVRSLEGADVQST